jgi:beta-barrel assembly-enhancing protease
VIPYAWRVVRTLVILVFVMLAPLGWLAARADEDEAQMGAEVYNQLKSQNEIVASSPLYDVLRPIAQRITRVVQPQYAYPIHFYIVHEKNPNAFAAPGGNVYVIDSLFYFVHNTEELAGTLCHETSHLLHHDSAHEMQHDQAIRRREFLAGLLFGTSLASVLAIGAVADLDSAHYSRGAEEAADLKGADTCASAGYNPWGLVWLFQEFSSSGMQAPPEVLSDHPNDEHRIEALEQHFKEDPQTFARFDSDIKNATPIKLPASKAETFVQQ